MEVKSMKNTGSFNEYILKDLKTDEDIKEWINIGFEEFLQDNDLNAFVKALPLTESILGTPVEMSPRL